MFRTMDRRLVGTIDVESKREVRFANVDHRRLGMSLDSIHGILQRSI